ncbi:MAG: DNA-binding response regulator [Opitutaceae bacterium]|nr:DNA-binding response regulator [Opitutaceae bacterium]|tara:strand:- start:7604 stop:9010 length:1407 start_codon:yes stop_codon:yes gene_type:complete
MDDSLLTGISILVLEDDKLLSRRLSAYLETRGAEVMQAEEVEEARNLVKDFSFDVALSDINLPDGNGMDLLKEGAYPDTCRVLIMTAEGGVETAVEAMRLGAVDFLAKPFELDELSLVILRSRRQQKKDRIETYRQASEEKSSDLFFGSSMEGVRLALDRILETDRRLGDSLPPVLLIGQTGTGKTSIARWIHKSGPRSEKLMVEVNCSALPESLAESELFGHERGAFTDAKTARIGLFEAADGGALFLDELASLSLPIQAKVLKAIEDQEIRRLGGTKSIKINIRLIAAGGEDLKDRVAQGLFREDLYHRLDLLRIELPPLVQRKADLAELAAYLIGQLSQRYKVDGKHLAQKGIERLLAYNWPGNVRELAHELERSLIFEENDALELAMLAGVDPAGSANIILSEDTLFNPAFEFPDEGFSIEETILDIIQRALKQTNQNVSAAARLLGVNRDYIRYRLSGKKSAD